VSWNGGGFDLPVLHYRGLRHGVEASKYWDMGEDDREFKWNNYISRYHMRHLDLMDLLAMYTAQEQRAAGRAGQAVRLSRASWAWTARRCMPSTWKGLEDIRRYCETDVMNTYLVYCRFQKMRGGFTEAEYEQEIAFVKETLALAPTEPHWEEYLAPGPETIGA
jgi:3'-5' exonuclease